MLDLVVAGGLLVALAGGVQTISRRARRRASPVTLLQEGLRGFEGADAEAFRAEFRRSGVVLPERCRPAGFA